MKRKAFILLITSIMMATMLTGCTFPGVNQLIGNIVDNMNQNDDDDSDSDDQDSDDSDNGDSDSNQVANPGNDQGNNGSDGVSDPSEIGIVLAGPNTVRDDTFFHVEHNIYDITYEQALQLVSADQNYKLLGSYAYPLINGKCPDDANYMILSNKAIEYALYEQEINGYASSDYESVVPVYVTGFNGYSSVFAENIYAFSGVSYLDDYDNPFYQPTEEKKQRIHDELVSSYGETVGEEYYSNYLTVLETPFIECMYLTCDYSTQEMESVSGYGGTYFVDVDANGEGTLYIVDVMIDMKTYAMSIQNPDFWLEYHIKIAEDGNSYVLTSDSGFSLVLEKASDDYLVGYVDDDSKAFHDIVGFELCTDDYFYPYCGKATADSYECVKEALENSKIVFSDGTVALDPQYEFLDGNRVRIKIETVYDYNLEQEILRHFVLTAEYGLIGYVHGENAGFALSDATGTYYFTFDRNTYCTSKLGERYVSAHSFEDNLAKIAKDNTIEVEDYDDGSADVETSDENDGNGNNGNADDDAECNGAGEGDSGDGSNGDSDGNDPDGDGEDDFVWGNDGNVFEL